MNKEEFITYCKEINIEIIEDKYSKLFRYYELLKEWNNKFNLTNITEEKDVFLLHFYDSLCLTKAENLYEEKTVCDFGTGAGFPGLVLSIIFDKLKITLVESNNKKCEFLNYVIKELNLKNAKVICSRIEDYSKNNRELFDIVTCRAVTSIPIILEIATSLIKVDGHLTLLKANCKEEIQKYKYLSNELGLKLENIIEYNLPVNNAYRAIPIYKKIKITDKKYPRNYSSIVKKYKNDK